MLAAASAWWMGTAASAAPGREAVLPITEIVRVIASAPGSVDGRAVCVDLAVDTDGRMGDDEDAIGYPAFWLHAGGLVCGPFEHEDEAVAAARERLGADFG